MSDYAIREYLKTFKGSGGGGTGGTLDYNELINKPQIEGVTLMGNKTFPNLNLNVLTNTEIEDIFDNLI